MPNKNVEVREYNLLMPVPPSANQMYRYLVVDGRVRPVPTAAYKAWKKAGKACLPAGDEGLYKGGLQLRWDVAIFANISHIRDLDNLAKAVIDLFAKHYGLNDGWVDEIHLKRTARAIGGRGLLFDTCSVGALVYDTGRRKKQKEGAGDGQEGEELPAE